MAYWTIQNLGAGNQARWKERQAARDQATQELRRLLNLVRREVISAYSQSEAAQRRVGIARRQLQTATAGYEADLRRIRGGQGLPIELLNSVDRLVTARRTLIRTVLAYNLSQFSLFVALGGQPVPAVLKPGS
jgi:outer membrane protein TolC